MAKHLKYLVEQNNDDFGFNTLGRVDSLFSPRTCISSLQNNSRCNRGYLRSR